VDVNGSHTKVHLGRQNGMFAIKNVILSLGRRKTGNVVKEDSVGVPMELDPVPEKAADPRAHETN